jgi:lipoprotein-anchoring transpeptidase ErfK/SrfK
MKSNSRLSVPQLIHYGIRLVEEDQADAARPFFEKALERDPENVMALLWLAGLGDNAADSYRYLSRALELDPENARSHAAIRWNHWREQDEKMRAAGFEVAASGQRIHKAAGVSRAAPTWLSGLAIFIVFVGALASIYLGQPLPAAATAAQVDAVLVQAAQQGATTLPGVALEAMATPPPLATRVAAFSSPTESAIAPVSTEPPSVTPTLPPAILPTETPATPTETPTLPTATAEPPTPIVIWPTNTPAAVVSNPTGSSGERWIDVDLSNQRLVAYEGDTPVYWVTVSTGLAGTPTVTGQYRIYVKYPAQTMSGPGYYLPDVPYVMYFYLGYGIHGTYWHNNFGQPMSHGCVNTPTPDAQWLYNWADVGTLVNVHY